MVRSKGLYAPYRQAERRLLSEWLALRYPNDRVQQQVRLGAYQPSIATEGLDRAELKGRFIPACAGNTRIQSLLNDSDKPASRAWC